MIQYTALEIYVEFSMSEAFILADHISLHVLRSTQRLPTYISQSTIDVVQVELSKVCSNCIRIVMVSSWFHVYNQAFHPWMKSMHPCIYDSLEYDNNFLIQIVPLSARLSALQKISIRRLLPSYRNF